MRLWSLHPSYLDTKGLVAVWREGLLALHVLRGQTQGYRHHPQLIRFQNHPEPIAALSFYLHVIVDEAEKRNYHFRREKLEVRQIVQPINVTADQLIYETEHLQKKLKLRDPQKLSLLETLTQFEAHPLFQTIPGKIETWEKISLK